MMVTMRTLAAVGCVLAVVGDIHAADDLDGFEAAKTTFLREMKKRSPIDRPAAIASLAEFPQKSTADLLIRYAFTNADAPQLSAAREALCKIAGDPKVWTYLFDEWKRPLKKAGLSPLSAEQLRALAMTADDDQSVRLIEPLDEAIAGTASQILVPMTIMDELATAGTKEALHGLETLAKSKLTATRFGYRRCVVQAASKLPQPGAVYLLIQLLSESDGLIQADIIQALTRITGQNLNDSHREWKEWWSANSATFVYPKSMPPLAEIDLKRPTYYGIPICAKRVVFVLDTSGSMAGEPIERAKDALINAIDSLPEVVQFDVVLFDIDVIAWKPGLVPATPQFKAEAKRVVQHRNLHRGTSSSAALHMAFGLDPEVIYFLSDGEPTDHQPGAILGAIARLNRTRRISLHTIGINTNEAGINGLINFMQPLAEQNYGIFQQVK